MIFSIASVVLRLSFLYNWVKSAIPFSSSYFIDEYSGVEKQRPLCSEMYTFKNAELSGMDEICSNCSQGGGLVHIIKKWQMPQSSYPFLIRSEGGHDNLRIKTFNSPFKGVQYPMILSIVNVCKYFSTSSLKINFQQGRSPINKSNHLKRNTLVHKYKK